MVLRTLLAAALWAAALPAAAQRAGVVLPSAETRLGGTAIVAPPVTSLSPAALTPALAVPSLLPSAGAPILAPAPAKLQLIAVMPQAAAAVAQFQALDLTKAPAAASKGAADEVFSALVGERASAPAALTELLTPAADIRPPLAPPDAARPPSSGAKVHLLSKPLEQTAKLGPTARVLHYALETAIQFVKAGLAWKATGSPMAAVGLLAFELIKMPPMITAQSLADLGLRYWWRKLAVLKEVSANPAVTRVRVLTTGETKFSGILAVRQTNTGLIFVDADGPLPATMKPYGSPIPVSDLGERRVRLVLVHDGVSELEFWTPTLGQLLAGERLPEDVAKAWRGRLDLDKKEKGRLARIFDFGKEKELRVEAHLSDGAGGETSLGTVAFGRGVKSLVGLGRWDQVRALFGGTPRARSIGLSDTVVERKGEKGPGGFFARAWRRLTGRLIVR